MARILCAPKIGTNLPSEYTARRLEGEIRASEGILCAYWRAPYGGRYIGASYTGRIPFYAVYIPLAAYDRASYGNIGASKCARGAELASSIYAICQATICKMHTWIQNAGMGTPCARSGSPLQG